MKTYIVTRRFISGSLYGLTLPFITPINFTEAVGQTLGGNELGPYYIVVSCEVNK